MRSDRLNQMEALILSNGTVTLYDLAKHFDISLNTVRRDVAALIERGHIRKVYGGVSSIDALESQAFATLAGIITGSGSGKQGCCWAFLWLPSCCVRITASPALGLFSCCIC